ncbi:hypothetical protein Acr_08g0002260 [Actinidia rufa]|uniref:EF-hand domain-containing protein n=1 Tax=Actinidia rufa TaxID=165716 RepID=A0A7J0EZI0_9ERIC|nr:hypothetical protein Acr_08g0002260 [Actinidia rufa]
MEILHSVVLLIFAVGKVQSRSLRLELNSSELVSDGVNNADCQSPFLSLNSLSLNGLFSSSETCEHYYGFFPCADNFGGYLFQIVVYEYLLATGEKFLTKGSKQLFNLIGTGFFGDVFEILMVLPEILVVLISGLAESKEVAQSRISIAVGMYSGITVFCLTLTWGICVIFGSKSFTAENSPSQDSEAPTSRPMLIRKKLSFLTSRNMERHATGKLVTNEGTPNISVIKSFFAKIDKDGDQSVSVSELEALILEIKSAKVQLDKEYAVAEVLNSFDVVVQDWFEKRRHELAKSEHLMSRILKHVQNHALETQGLLTDEGRPNVDGIKSIFENIDKNNNKYISESELKELIQNIKFGKAQPDPAMVVESVMKDFDKDGDHMISEQEFAKGITKWLHNDTRLANSKDAKMLTDKFDQITWKEVDSLVHKGKGDRSIIHKLLSWDCVKSVLQIVLGVAIVSFLADPLIYSILDLSVALGLPTFYISFVIIPFALKFKLAMSAIFPASQKSLTTSSLTFSEVCLSFNLKFLSLIKFVMD